MRGAIILLGALALGLVGCVDNSGGDPPDGAEIEEFTRLSLDSGGLSCFLFEDGAALVRDADDVQAFYDGMCADTQAPAMVRDEFSEAVDGLADDEVIVVLSIQSSGCLGQHGVFGFFLSEDEQTVTAWVKRDDATYGVSQPSCTADLSGSWEAWIVSGVPNATEASVLIGPFNSNLAGAPDLPG